MRSIHQLWILIAFLHFSSPSPPAEWWMIWICMNEDPLFQLKWNLSFDVFFSFRSKKLATVSYCLFLLMQSHIDLKWVWCKKKLHPSTIRSFLVKSFWSNIQWHSHHKIGDAPSWTYVNCVLARSERCFSTTFNLDASYLNANLKEENNASIHSSFHLKF